MRGVTKSLLDRIAANGGTLDTRAYHYATDSGHPCQDGESWFFPVLRIKQEHIGTTAAYAMDNWVLVGKHRFYWDGRP